MRDGDSYSTRWISLIIEYPLGYMSIPTSGFSFFISSTTSRARVIVALAFAMECYDILILLTYFLFNCLADCGILFGTAGFLGGAGQVWGVCAIARVLAGLYSYMLCLNEGITFTWLVFRVLTDSDVIKNLTLTSEFDFSSEVSFRLEAVGAVM